MGEAGSLSLVYLCATAGGVVTQILVQHGQKIGLGYWGFVAEKISHQDYEENY